jgi:hypothetical protein
MEPPLRLGWREWCVLPDLGIPAIKTKVDTGAKTSALHTFKLMPFREGGIDYIRFFVHPLQKNGNVVRECVARIKEERQVTDSGGHKELRFIIETRVLIGNITRRVEMSLTNRDTMRFRMLLGRRAMTGNTVVDPAKSYLNGRLEARSIYRQENKKTNP